MSDACVSKKSHMAAQVTPAAAGMNLVSFLPILVARSAPWATNAAVGAGQNLCFFHKPAELKEGV